MTTSIKALREKRAGLAKEARNLLDTNTNAWTKEVSAKVDAIYAELDLLDDQITKHERSLTIENDLEAPARIRAAQTGRSVDEEVHIRSIGRQAFNAWARMPVRAGLETVKDDKVRDVILQGIQAAATSPNSAGGYLVQTDVQNAILERLKAFGGMREVATVLRTGKGNPLQWPTIDDTSNVGELVAEATTATVQDVAFGAATLGAFRYSSKIVPVSIELLQDEAVDIEALLYDQLTKRLGRITNTHFTTGTGAGAQPSGVVFTAGLGKTGLTGQTTSVIYDDFVDLEHSVDPGYRIRNECAWMMADSSLKVVKKIKDTAGRPIWTPGTSYQAGLGVADPDTINGYRYVINQDVAAMAANAKSILFGNFKSYFIRDVMDITFFRFEDSAYMKLGQVAFLAFMRADGKMMAATAADPVKYYANSAT